jgi:hypothetical protein
MQRVLKVLALLALFGLLLGAGLPLYAAPVSQDAQAAAQTELANATYLSDYTDSGTVTLVDGEFDDRDAMIHTVLTEWIAYGDLDGNGVDDAAVLLASNTGGSGVFVELHAVLNTKEGPSDAAYVMLGDRVEINDLTVENGVITVDLVTQGADDAMCCPTMPVITSYALSGSELIADAQRGVDALAVLANMSYTLPDMADYAEGGEVTLVDGVFDVEAAPGSAERAMVSTTGYAAFGDLNGDEIDDAAVVLTARTGGTGVFYYLATVLNQDGVPVHAGTAFLGDRVILNDLFIEAATVVLDMIRSGPSDPLCCPTEPVEQIYALEGETLELVDETIREPEAEEETATVDAGAEALFATLNLGGTDSLWLDPTMVSVLSGAVNGPAADASLLGAECAGTIPAQPDVVLNWTADEAVESLRFFFLSAGDPTMLIVTPDGEYLCNDDVNPLLLDPMIEVENPAEGRYAIFMGAFENDAVLPGFLTITSQDYTPANLNLGDLLQREVDPAAAGESLAPDVLGTDAATSAAVAAADTPIAQELVGGGATGAFNIEVGNPLCTGFIAADPTFSFEWTGQADTLRIFFEADNDSTLMVKTPQDRFECNDDAGGANNLNPLLDLTPVDGTYTVWVGSFSPTEAVTGTLTIAGDLTIEPDALSSAALEDN